MVVPGHICGQVTIGSNKNPSPLSLLDLKERDADGNNTTSNRGLGLPRVKLTDLSNLYPMFETSPGSKTPIDSYKAANKAPLDEKHTGLVVYNLNKCDGFGTGTYVWIGNKWEPMGKVDVLYTPDISIADKKFIRVNDSTLLTHVPSGRDLRIFPSDNKFSLKLDWQNPADGNMIRTDTAEIGKANGADGGLKFINSSHPTTWLSPVVTSPVTFDYYIKDMKDIIPTDNANVDNPFRSRETSVTFGLAPNECYPTGRKITIRLNQTNYRLTVKRDNAYFNTHSYRFRTESEKFPDGVNYYRFLLLTPYSGANASNFEEETNARRYARYEEVTPGILAPDIVPNNIPVESGEERINGTSVIYTRAPEYISTSTAQNKRKKAGILTYTDTAAIARFYPAEIHYVQCYVDGYDQSEIKTAVTDPAQWGTDVLRHTDRDGNTFYSADFGSAGRWMITNLAAITYDEGSGREGEKLATYQTIDLHEHDGGKKKYAYPFLDATTGEAANWGARPAGWLQEEGIFYNWYAATGRSYNDADNYREGAYGNQTYAEPPIVQGICPKGWYLPSDTEWTELEKHIYGNIGKYDTFDAVDVTAFGGPTWNNDWNNNINGAYRGKTIEDEHVGHGAAMKDICPPKSTGTAFTYMQGSKGYSKEYNLGGFNATLVGRIKATKDNGTAQERRMIQTSRAYDVTYWSRSQNSMHDAWMRSLNVNMAGVYRATYVKTHLVSVRCKKRN